MKITAFYFSLLLLITSCGKEIDSTFENEIKTDTMAALPSTELSLSAIRDALGESSTDLHGLYNSPLINAWSPAKPYNEPTDTPGHGLKHQTVSPYKCYLDMPNPAYGDQLGHFRGYDHSYQAPILFEVTDVKTMDGVSKWNGGSPILWLGEMYKWTFRFKRGVPSINPTDINPLTNEVIQWGGEAGGIYVAEYTTITQADDINWTKVYSVTTSWQTVTDYVAECGSRYGEVGDKGPFDVYYMNHYSGNIFRLTNYRIENSHPVGNNDAWWEATNFFLGLDTSNLGYFTVTDNEGSYLMEYIFEFGIAGATADLRHFTHYCTMSDMSTVNPTSFRYCVDTGQGYGAWSDWVYTFTNNNEIHLPSETLMLTNGHKVKVQTVYYLTLANFYWLNVILTDDTGWIAKDEDLSLPPA